MKSWYPFIRMHDVAAQNITHSLENLKYLHVGFEVLTSVIMRSAENLKYLHVGFEVLTLVIMRSAVMWA
jgi:hypothetical protein